MRLSLIVLRSGNSLSVRVWVSTPKRDAVVGKTVDGRSHSLGSGLDRWMVALTTNDNEITGEHYISVGVGA